MIFGAGGPVSGRPRSGTMTEGQAKTRISRSTWLGLLALFLLTGGAEVGHAQQSGRPNVLAQ